MDYRNINDYEMLYLIGEKDERAEKILYGKYRNLIVKIAQKFLKIATERGGELDDLIQEGYIGLYSAIRHYNTNNDALFFSFASICIERQMSTYCRSLRAKKNEILNLSYSLEYPVKEKNLNLLGKIGDITYDPYRIMNQKDIEEELLHFKNSLDPETAAIFELRINGFGYKEIEILLQCSVKKIENALARIRSRLKNKRLKEKMVITTS